MNDKTPKIVLEKIKIKKTPFFPSNEFPNFNLSKIKEIIETDLKVNNNTLLKNLKNNNSCQLITLPISLKKTKEKDALNDQKELNISYSITVTRGCPPNDKETKKLIDDLRKMSLSYPKNNLFKIKITYEEF